MIILAERGPRRRKGPSHQEISGNEEEGCMQTDGDP